MSLQASSLAGSALLAAASYATNNAAGGAVDLSQFEGTVGVVVNIGVKTVGDNNGAVTVQLQASADNTATNASNITGVLNTTNNTAAFSVIQVDPRAVSQFLFARVILSGTNSPAYPIGAEVIGTKKYR